MVFFIQSIINTLIQVLIYIYYLEDFYFINNSTPHGLIDYLIFGSYTFLLFLILRFVLFFLPHFLLRKIHHLFACGFFVLYETLLLLFTLVDSKIYLSQGLHIYDKIVIETVTNTKFNREIQFGTTMYLSVFLVVLLIVFFESWLWKWCSHRCFRIFHKQSILVVSIILVGVGLIFTSFAIFDFIPRKGEVANIYPFYAPIKGKPGQDPLTIDYHFPDFEKIKINRKANVLFIMAESFRYDVFKRELMPNIFKFIDEHDCLVSKYHYSGGHSTEYGIFSALYGLYAYHYNDFRDQKVDSFGMSLLKYNNYEINGSSASQVKNWNQGGFMFRLFSDYREFHSNKNVHMDDVRMVRWSLKKLLENKDKNQFLFTFFNTTHHNYFYPPSFEKYTPTIEVSYNFFQDAKKYRTEIFNRYKNSTMFLDHTVSGYINKALEVIGEDTLIIFSGDHGEEFWEEGLFGHAHVNYINPRVRVPLFICDMKGPLKSVNFSSHVDIFPTILDLMKVDFSEDKKMFNGFSLASLGNKKRPYLVITGTQFPHGRNKVGIIDGRFKFWLKKVSSKLHHLYKYRSSDLEDRPVLDGSDKNALKLVLKRFSEDAYRFFDTAELE